MDALALALPVAALAVGVHVLVLTRSGGRAVARPVAFLQAARWGVVVALVVWHWWWTLRRPRGGPE